MAQPSRPVVALVAAAFVVGVVVLASRVVGPQDAAPPPGEERTSEAAVPAALPQPVVTRLTASGAPGLQCRGAVTAVPEVPDETAQQEVALEALQTVDDPRFEVVLAGPTHLGVVAVVDGDADAAREALPDVAHVVTLSLPLRTLGDGADDHEAQLAWVVSALLDPVAREVREAVGGLPGERSIATWPSGGSVVVRWATPVPAAVRDLVGVRADGVRVIVVGCSANN